MKDAEKQFISDVEKLLLREKETIKSFSKRVIGEPSAAMAAMQWCDDVFESVAKIAVFEFAIAKIKSGSSLNDVSSEAAVNALRGARYVPSSTSKSANILQLYKNAAWAELAETNEKY